MTIDPIVRQIVDRCYVGDSNLRMLRYLKSRTRKGAWRRCTRTERRDIMRQAIKVHADNLRLYCRVMRGM